MTHPNPLKTARLALAGLLLLATSAAALPLPVNLHQDLQTPVGGVDIATDAPTCIDVATPPLPPAPVPLPVNPYAKAQACAGLGPDGLTADASADAAGIAQAGAHADADVPVEESQGFFDQIIEALFGWL